MSRLRDSIETVLKIETSWDFRALTKSRLVKMSFFELSRPKVTIETMSRQIETSRLSVKALSLKGKDQTLGTIFQTWDISSDFIHVMLVSSSKKAFFAQVKVIANSTSEEKKDFTNSRKNKPMQCCDLYLFLVNSTQLQFLHPDS